jgi:hypothetical protein
MTKSDMIYSIDQHYCKYCILGSEPCFAMEHYVKNGVTKCSLIIEMKSLVRKDKLKIWEELHG